MPRLSSPVGTSGGKNYSENNPAKYQADIKAAARKVRDIERYLKDIGVLELTEKEKLEKELDRAFLSKQRGRRVQRKEVSAPVLAREKSRSRKTVTEWGKSWELVEE